MLTRLLLATVMTLSTLGATTLVATPAANASTATFATDLERAIQKYTNVERGKHGRRAVVWSSCVDRYAEGWASRIRTAGRLYHRDWRVIVRGCNKSYASENVGQYLTGDPSADSVARTFVKMWMNSKGHRANLLSGKARTIGVGAARTSSGRWYVVQNFAS